MICKHRVSKKVRGLGAAMTEKQNQAAAPVAGACSAATNDPATADRAVAATDVGAETRRQAAAARRANQAARQQAREADKERRRAEALRANLHRRKAQARDRQSGDDA